MRRAAMLLPLLGAASAYVDFQPIPTCGNTFGDGCQHQNQGKVDQVVSLFFQYEPAQGSTQAGSFSCTGDGVTYCARTWPSSAESSAGDCFFVLGAGRQFQCQSQGNTKLIQADAADMQTTIVQQGASSEQVPCTGTSGCSYTNTGKDEYVGLAFSSQAASSIKCHYGKLEVCSWTVTSAGGAGSCNFILPSQATLTCTGNAQVTSAQALRLSESVLDVSAPLEAGWNCPNVTYPKPNMCDCTYTNPHVDKDLVVSVSSASTDNTYNSFHCFSGGSNVCAWGSNRNNQGDAGGCWFILGAGEELSCAMQWGAASFSFSAAVATTKGLFVKTEAPRKAAVAAAKGVSGVAEVESAAMHARFGAWKKRHGVSYASEAEEALRFANFRAHVALAGPKPWYNNLADLSREEFETSYRGCGRAQVRDEAKAWRGSADVRIPAAFDWRNNSVPVLTPVKNQGQCGSCWSFSTTGLLESAWAIAGNPLVSLSEQNLVSCDNKDGNNGCGGGWPWRAVDYVVKNGIDTDASYPYVSGKGQVPECHAGTKAAVQVKSHFDVASNEDAMAQYVAEFSPLSICVDAMTQLWWPYTGGIMTGCCNHECDHAILIVGYGEQAGTKYWTIKNSWGVGWGEQGYIRLERGTNQCGITTNPIAAVVEGGPTLPPTPAPTPPTGCPPQAVFDGSSCMWVNGTNGVVMPPPEAIGSDCIYFDMGYLAYTWPKSTAGAYPCPKPASTGAGSDDFFCTWNNNQRGVYWPKGAKAECSQLSEGKIGYSW